MKSLIYVAAAVLVIGAAPVFAGGMGEPVVEPDPVTVDQPTPESVSAEKPVQPHSSDRDHEAPLLKKLR